MQTAGERSVVSGSALLITHDLVRAGRLAHALSSAGFVVTLAFDGQHALACLRDIPSQVVLVDLRALGSDPRGPLRSLHRLTAAPLLALIDRRDDELEVALTAGAAAAVPVDASAEELVAQVAALLGLSDGAPAGLVAGLATWGPIVLDHGRHRVLVHGHQVGVTPLQSRLLAVLLAAGGNVVTHSSIYRLLWRCGVDDEGQRLAAHIHRLRDRLGGQRCAGALVANVRGVGYRMLEPDEVAGVCDHPPGWSPAPGSSVVTEPQPDRLIVLPDTVAAAARG